MDYTVIINIEGHVDSLIDARNGASAKIQATNNVKSSSYGELKDIQIGDVSADKLPLGEEDGLATYDTSVHIDGELEITVSAESEEEAVNEALRSCVDMDFGELSGIYPTVKDVIRSEYDMGFEEELE